jgi:hypothetical protein
LGKVPGSYAYQIATPGWPTGTVDNYAFINMTVSSATTQQPPSVILSQPADMSVFTYTAGGSPVLIPLQFQATATATAPLTQLNADVNGVVVTLSTVGLGTANATGTGTISIAAPGIYTVSAHATNVVGTSLTTAEFTVNLVTPPPTVTIAQPALNSTYVYATGAPPLAIPFSFSAASLGGSLSALSATLNGSPVTVTASGLGTLNATGTGTLSVNAAGTYTFAATATTPNGTTSVTSTFTVTAQTPAASVTISKPTSGAVFQIKPCCGDVLSIPFAFTAKAAGSGTISTLSATLNGATVSVKGSGLGTATATGTGTLRVSAAGTYTLAATAISGGVSTVSKAFFTVQETVPSLVWLPPLSLGKVQNGGSTLPIKFQLQFADTGDNDDNHCNRDDDDDDDGHGSCGGRQNGNDCDHHGDCSGHDNDDDHQGNCDDDDDDCTIKDTSVKIAIYEVLANGGSSTVQVFSYGGSPNPPTYSIDGDGQYQLNFPTAKQGAHRYHIDVYRFPAGSTTPQLLGTKEFTTR